MLKLQYFGHLMGRMDSFKKTLMLGKIEGGRRRGMRWLRGWDGWITSPMSWVWVNSGRWTGKPSMLQSMGLQSQTRLSNWTELENLSLEDEIDQSRRKDTETYIPPSEVGIAISSMKQGHRVWWRCLESIWDLQGLEVGKSFPQAAWHAFALCSYCFWFLSSRLWRDSFKTNLFISPGYCFPGRKWNGLVKNYICINLGFISLKLEFC